MRPSHRSFGNANEPLSPANATLYFMSGMAAVLMAYSIYSNVKSFRERNAVYTSRRKREVMRQEANKRVEDSIPLRSLALLTQSSNASIQSGAVKIVLDRAMSETYLPVIVQACKKESPLDTREKAVSSLHLLTRRDSNRPALLAAGVLDILVETLKDTEPPMSESAQRYAAVAICDLIQGSDGCKCYIVELDILNSIKRILTSTTIRNNELRYWTLMILYQITRTEPFPKILIQEGFVAVLAKMARMTYGNTNMPKFCIQSLVRIVSNVEVGEAKSILEELLDYKIIDLISISLRAEDLELVYWAAGLMHEFVVKDVALQSFREIRGLHSILNALLGAEEIYISRVVLRTIKYMAYGQAAERFRQEMIDSGMVQKIMRSLTLDDDDVRYWSVLCINTVAAQVESHQDIIGSNEFKLFLELTVSRKVHVAIFSSEILSLICCITSNCTILEPYVDEVVSSLNNLLSYDELDVQYNAAGAVFNLMSMRDDFACHVREQCQDTLISMCVASTHERVQLTCAKALMMMTIKFPSITSRVIYQVIKPLINTSIEISRHALPIVLMQTVLAISGHRDGTAQHQQKHHTSGNIRVSTHIPTEENESYQSDSSSSSSSTEESNMTSLFMKFELPIGARIQFVGALSALRILLENRDVYGNVVSGTEDEALLADMTKMDYTLDEGTLRDYDVKTRHSTRLADLNEVMNDDVPNEYIPSTPAAPPLSSITSSDTLPDSVRRLAESLMMLALHPVLNAWGAERPDIQLDNAAMQEEAAREWYYDVIAWLQQSTAVITSQQKPPRSQKPSTRPKTYAPSDSSDDSEIEYEEDDDGDDQPFIMTKKVESAAERLGETRRKGEEHDSTIVDEVMAAGQPLHFAKLYSGFASRAWMLLRSLVRYGSIRHFLVHEMNIVEAMIYIFQNCRPLSDHVLTCLGTMICADPACVIPKSAVQVMAISIWRSAQVPMTQKRSFHFYARLILTFATRSISPASACDNHPAFVEIDLHRRSRYCLLNYETRLEARNDSWTFETVRATHHTPPLDSDPWSLSPAHKYAFEVVLATEGLMQVGWVSEEFGIDPEGGTGVGDDAFSYGYDGCRVKKWHKQDQNRRKSYGQRWAVGDTITCCLDLDQREIRYYQNGQDLGVAFTDIDTSKVWYPAISLSTGQENRFRFGGALDKLRFLPEGYTSISQLALPPISIELPPPHMGRRHTIESEKSDEVDHLTCAMEKMTVDVTPHEMDGSEEPSLRPVRVGKFEDDIPSTQSMRILDSRAVSRDDQSILPSLYFEMTIAYYDKKLTNDDELDGTIVVGMQSLHEDSHVRLEYEHLDKQATVFQGTIAQTEPFSMDIADGDVVGMLYIQERNAMYITLNGSITVIVDLLSASEGGDRFLPFLPYRSGDVKTHINYGDELFRWQRANSMSAKEKMRRYLGQLLS
ncbi:ARM repeat-containing protein [Lichtheimia hyalospora FSU 10163]|nr:ARM repeat-containing protein [Lichtheimia hyalospora FSU 10163]